MTTYPHIVHGSADSLDHDVHVVIDSFFEEKAKNAELCKAQPYENPNLIVIRGGQVVWTYKGAVDECNNAIMRTFALHKQPDFDTCPVTKRMERNTAVKVVRTVRGMLGQLTRTQHRVVVKEALRSKNLTEKIAVLKSIRLEDCVFDAKRDPVEIRKFLAFQLGQTYDLLRLGYEHYTKREVAIDNPWLAAALYREPTARWSDIQLYWDNVLESIEELFFWTEDGLVLPFNSFTGADVFTEQPSRAVISGVPLNQITVQAERDRAKFLKDYGEV